MLSHAGGCSPRADERIQHHFRNWVGRIGMAVDAALHYIFQLAHITRPIMRQQLFASPIGANLKKVIPQFQTSIAQNARPARQYPLCDNAAVADSAHQTPADLTSHRENALIVTSVGRSSLHAATTRTSTCNVYCHRRAQSGHIQSLATVFPDWQTGGRQLI